MLIIETLMHCCTMSTLCNIGFDNAAFFLGVDYLRADTHKATSGKTETFFLGGAGRLYFQYTVVEHLRGPWPRARPPGIKNPSFLRCSGPQIPHPLPGELPPPDASLYSREFPFAGGCFPNSRFILGGSGPHPPRPPPNHQTKPIGPFFPNSPH